MSVVEISVSAAQPTTEIIRVSLLPVGSAWRSAGINDSHVATLCKYRDRWAPIVVHRERGLIIDGAHRAAAARRLGVHALAVEWFDGSVLEGFGRFLALNAACALPVTVDDRELGAARVLAAEPSWSDRRIASVCGVAPKSVARLRRTCSSDVPMAKRIGRDGRARPVSPAAHREAIVAALAADPAASLRHIAGQVGVSPETVRRVRKELEAAPGPCWNLPDPPADANEGRPATTRSRVEAFDSTPSGCAFMDWFHATDINDDMPSTHGIPISRVYEVADEARRRAAFWLRFAKTLEARTRLGR